MFEDQLHDMDFMQAVSDKMFILDRQVILMVKVNMNYY